MPVLPIQFREPPAGVAKRTASEPLVTQTAPVRFDKPTKPGRLRIQERAVSISDWQVDPRRIIREMNS